MKREKNTEREEFRERRMNTWERRINREKSEYKRKKNEEREEWSSFDSSLSAFFSLMRKKNTEWREENSSEREAFLLWRWERSLSSLKMREKPFFSLGILLSLLSSLSSFFSLFIQNEESLILLWRWIFSCTRQDMIWRRLHSKYICTEANRVQGNTTLLVYHELNRVRRQGARACLPCRYLHPMWTPFQDYFDTLRPLDTLFWHPILTPWGKIVLVHPICPRANRPLHPILLNPMWTPTLCGRPI